MLAQKRVCSSWQSSRVQRIETPVCAAQQTPDQRMELAPLAAHAQSPYEIATFFLASKQAFLLRGTMQ
jgi:hypothetical protein